MRFYSENPNQATTGYPPEPWDHIYSDHAQTFLIDDQLPLRCMTWNILTRCRRRPERFNNGLGKIESLEEYENRLSRIAPEIERQIISKQLDFVFLQEVSLKYFLPLLKYILPQNWQIISKPMHGTDFFNIIAIDGQRYQFQALELETYLLSQHGRVLTITIKKPEQSQPFLCLLNVHFNPKQIVDETVKALIKHGHHKMPWLIGGDFNTPIKDIIGLLNETHPKFANISLENLGESFSFNIEENKPNPLKYIDGFLLSHSLNA